MTKQLFRKTLAAVALLGIMASAQAQDTAKFKFKKFEYETAISAKYDHNGGVYGISVTPWWSNQFNIYIAPNVSVVMKHDMSVTLGMELGSSQTVGIKYKYFTGKKYSIVGEQLFGILGFNRENMTFLSETYPAEFCFDVNNSDGYFKIRYGFLCSDFYQTNSNDIGRFLRLSIGLSYCVRF